MELTSAIQHKILRIKDHVQEFRNEGRTFFASSSFQTHSLPMLHVLSRIAPEMPVYFIQTGFHFKKTKSKSEIRFETKFILKQNG